MKQIECNFKCCTYGKKRKTVCTSYRIRAFELETVMPEKLRAAASDVNTFVEKAKSVYSHRRADAGTAAAVRPADRDGEAHGKEKRCKRHGWKRLQKSDMIF